MRRLALGNPLPGNNGFERWATDALREIERASAEDVEAVLSEFTVTEFTATRTLDASTATLDDLKNFVATMVDDIQKRGQKRSYAG